MFKKVILPISTVLFCAFILLLSLRGQAGNPDSGKLNSDIWKDNGPLELSPERGRFALTYSLVEDKSFFFNDRIAHFATPDLGFFNGKYVSLFAPGLSFLIVPGYILGKYLGATQLGSFAVISVFALINLILIRAIAMRLGASAVASTIGALIFLFATPAFAYSVSLFQHQVSTFLILSSLLIILKYNNFWSLSLVWLLCAASIPIDYPNLFLMFPIGIFALSKIIYSRVNENGININLKLVYLLTFASIILPLSFFMWFNKLSYGNPFKLSGTVPRVLEFDEENNPRFSISSTSVNLQTITDPAKQEKSAIKFFNPRNLLNGFYIHFLSQDRGILYFAPIIFLGIFGIYFFYGKNRIICTLLIGIIGSNILLYSMWGDPYGGWAFGSRYLIPGYAIMSVFIALALSKWKNNLFFIFIFVLIALYSSGVKTLGALTTSRNPPKIEATGLSQLTGRQEKYSFDRNIDFLFSQGSKSYIYQTFANKYMDAREYYFLIYGLIAVFTISLVILLNRE